MPRPPKAREPLKQAALQLFVENGVHATGIREIARHAGCSEAALYRHWPNKEALVAQLFQEHLGTVVDLMRANLVGDQDHTVCIRRCCQAIYELYDSQPMVFRFVLLVQHEMAQFLPPDLAMPQDVLRDFFAGLHEHDRCRRDPNLVSAAAIGIFLQTANYVVYGRLDGPLAAYADDVSDMAITLLG